MLMAGLCLPLQPIIQELLCYLQLSPFQVIPNGWRLFLALYMIWPEINLGHQMSILEFFAIYWPVYSKIETLAFTVRAKQQFVMIKQIVSFCVGCILLDKITSM
jgi:hypothetical protein